MAYYDLSKEERAALAKRMGTEIARAAVSGEPAVVLQYAGDEDTYIRKNVYLSLGRLYSAEPRKVLKTIAVMLASEEPEIRQTAINAAGEIGRKDFEPVRAMMDEGLKDAHHMVRNAVIGSVKKMGEKNPAPVIAWAKNYLSIRTRKYGVKFAMASSFGEERTRRTSCPFSRPLNRTRRPACATRWCM